MNQAQPSTNTIDQTILTDIPEMGFDQAELNAILSELGDQCTPPPKLYRIGEVIQYSGFSRQTVHNYTAMGLIQESRWTQTGHRLYDAEVFRRLALIKRLKSRYSLAKIKMFLDRAGF
ncbi:MAG: MerR family transcriptional regulator [Phycisphaerae bacterium]|jgi:hypothetical protein|nr:MerR family transcriptional regulator [Phycisphaerae bacterium]